MKPKTTEAREGGTNPQELGDLTLLEPAPTLEVSTDLEEGSSRRCASPGAPPEQMSLAPELHPRERLLEAGPEALAGSELLALLLGGEPTRALELAGDVISQFGGLAGLRSASCHDLVDECGLSEAWAAVVLAAAELAKRLASARIPERPTVSSPQDVDEVIGARMRDLDREHFVVMLLDTKNRVLGTPTVSVGTLSSSLVHAREVFKPAIKASAANVILCHNHPSASLAPSVEDRQITKKMAQAGEHIGIEVLDHVIFGGDSFFSLKEHQML